MQDSDFSITNLIQRVKATDASAANAICERFFSLLARHADRKLGGLQRHVDGEEIAVSCLDQLCRKLSNGHYPDLSNSSELWSLLVRMSEQKAIDRRRKLMMQKLGGGDVRGESVFLVPEQGLANHAVDLREPTAEDYVNLQDSLQCLLDRLPSDHLRETVLSRMAGVTNEEIAERQGISKRTVQLRLQTIAEDWQDALHSQPDFNTIGM